MSAHTHSHLPSPQRLALLEALLAEEGLEAGQIDPGRRVPPILPVPRDGRLPLSFAQQRLWFFHQLEPDSPVYHIPIGLRLQGVPDTGTLARSLNEIVRRHEVLRTAIIAVDGQPTQVIMPAGPLPLPVIDLCSLPAAEREIKVQQLATEEGQRPFDLTQGPLLRALLLRLAEWDNILVLTMHHIASDGWSLKILVQELATLYKAFAAGKPSPLPPLPIQYADFAHWQRQWLEKEGGLAAQLAYWQQQLANISRLELLTDRPRPAVQTYRGALHSFTLPNTLVTALKQSSQQEGVTLFMTLLTAFQTLLARYTGQADISVGVPIANRNRVETEGLIGMFVNTLVLRTDLSGNPRFRELLGQVREMTLDAYANQDLPFEKLVEALQPERLLSTTPLFQVMFTLANAPTASWDLSGLTLHPVKIDLEAAAFDLTLAMRETEQGFIEGVVEYNTDLFDAATIIRMQGHLQTLLEGIVASPAQRLSSLPLLTEAERRQLLVAWNATQSDYPRGLCVHELVEAQVERTPDAVAVVYEGQALTYRELNQRANQLAHHLQKLGAGPEVLVGICMEPSVEMAVGLLGVLKAGGAYVPIDPAHPPERLAFILADTCAPVLLTQRRLLESGNWHPVDSNWRVVGGTITNNQLPITICLDSDWQEIAQQDETKPVSKVGPENLAYAIYTSGSTGVPKGVLIPHQALVNHNLAVAERYNLQPDDRCLQFASLSFDVAAEELFPCWMRGAAVVLRSDRLIASLAGFLNFVEREKLTVLNLPTPYWHEWVSEMARVGPQLTSQLRLVIVGSDKTSPAHLETWQKLVSQRVRWLNAYGPTEATITATIYEPLPGQENRGVGCVSIGRPIANVYVYVLDQYLNPVPIGVPGELHIGGNGLARGYLHHPAWVAEKFIPNPFCRGVLPERLYKTGDLVRYLPDGNLEFLGRIDHQVKIRGFRVELGEIEKALSSHRAVREAVVVTRGDSLGQHENHNQWDKRLVAYVVPDQSHVPTAHELQSFLKEKLPEYMVPSAFVLLETLPLTSRGKVNRVALPAPDQNHQEDIFVAPRTLAEKTIAELWAEMLGIDKVGIYDNFFDLGGHSLLGVRVISRLWSAFQVELSLATLFKAPTVAGLAEAIAHLKMVPPSAGMADGGDFEEIEL